MKISESNAKPVAGVAPAAIASSRGRARRASGASPTVDQIDLSHLSGHLAAAQGNSPEHLAKLSQLQGGVSNGGYQVDASVVSADIIQYSLQYGAA